MKGLRLWSTTMVNLLKMSGVSMLVEKLLIGHAILTAGVISKYWGSLKEMRYHSIKGLCYCIEMLLHPLDDDRGALNMLHIARHYGEVHMFVVHGVDEAQVEDNIVEPEGDVVRPLESGESSHAVSEFEVLRTKIVVRSAPPEDVRSAPLEDARN